MSSSLLCLVLAIAPAADYAKPELLAEASVLVKDPKGLILDVRGKAQYLRGHIPGAVWVDAVAWGKAFTPRASAGDWSKRLGDAGIDLDKPVVLCGSDDVREAARIWWIMRYWGVKDVRILNGGWPAWQAAGGQAAKEERHPQPRTLDLKARADRLATKDQLLTLLKGAPPQILDVRSTAEFCGDRTTAKRNGSIPGAINLEWSECIDAKTNKFKSSAELQQLFQDHKIDVNKPAITYCQSGGRASVMAFALELMGGNQVQNYYQSWAEWGNDPKTPVVKPSGKK
ncbi:MAG TPA: sulfurtransferase [Gemmataceae bacterium]|jgi:thiosulfate/3-mercaptopyruvate sulfurtransferase|nr:sulfurtransferase [Gemmataceae bacterium]